MATQDFKRELTAILSADVEGYSRLMSEDEEASVKTLITYRRIMADLVKQPLFLVDRTQSLIWPLKRIPD